MKLNDQIAYEAGWKASMRTTTCDLDAAERRFEARYGQEFDPCSMFSAGWSDCAAGNLKGTALSEDHLTSPWHRRNHPEA